MQARGGPPTRGGESHDDRDDEDGHLGGDDDGAVEVPVFMAEEDEILEAGITVQRVAAHFEADLHHRFGGRRLALAA